MEKFFANEFAPYVVKKEKKKLTLNKKDVTLNYVHSRSFLDSYKIVFLVNIWPLKQMVLDPSKRLTIRDVDMNSLKNAILLNIKEYDRRYMEIYKFDTFKVEFRIKKIWMDDSVKNIKSRINLTKFNRTFDLKKQAPYMITLNCSSDKGWNDYVVREFKKRVNDIELTKHFSFIKNKSNLMKKLRLKFDNMFDWSYDEQWNTITAKMKTFWILSLMAAVGYGINKAEKNKILSNSKKDFYYKEIQRNKDNMKEIDWKTFLKKYKTK